MSEVKIFLKLFAAYVNFLQSFGEFAEVKRFAVIPDDVEEFFVPTQIHNPWDDETDGVSFDVHQVKFYQYTLIWNDRAYGARIAFHPQSGTVIYHRLSQHE